MDTAPSFHHLRCANNNSNSRVVTLAERLARAIAVYRGIPDADANVHEATRVLEQSPVILAAISQLADLRDFGRIDDESYERRLEFMIDAAARRSG